MSHDYHVYADTEISDEQAIKYLKSRGQGCPVCDHQAIEGGGYDLDTGTIYQTMHCPECGAQWTHAYELDRILDTAPEYTRVAL